VAPCAEVAGVRVVEAIGSRIVRHLVVVHVVADHSRDLGALVAGTDVLAIATATGGKIVSIDTLGSGLSSVCGHLGVPGEISSGVVGTVDIVGFEDGGLIVIVADIVGDSGESSIRCSGGGCNGGG